MAGDGVQELRDPLPGLGHRLQNRNLPAGAMGSPPAGASPAILDAQSLQVHAVVGRDVFQGLPLPEWRANFRSFTSRSAPGRSALFTTKISAISMSPAFMA